jgi:hypothetical protein
MDLSIMIALPSFYTFRPGQLTRQLSTSGISKLRRLEQICAVPGSLLNPAPGKPAIEYIHAQIGIHGFKVVFDIGQTLIGQVGFQDGC